MREESGIYLTDIYIISMDEAAQAELETEAEAASSAFFHTEKGAFAYQIWPFFGSGFLRREEISRKPTVEP